MALQFRRGTEAERVADGFIPASGEPIYTTDSKKLYVGDGSTVGGVAVGTNNDVQDLEDVSLRSANIVYIESISAAENTVLITTKTPHGFATGDSVLVSTVGKTDLNGIKTISAVSINSFNYTATVDDFTEVSDAGAVRYEISDNAILAYDQATGNWVDQNFAYELQDLGDVKISSPAQDDILQYASIPIGNITDSEGEIVLEDVEQPAELATGQTWTATGSYSKFVNKQLSISIDDLNDVLIYEGVLSNRQYIGYDSDLTVWRNIDYVDNLEDLSNVTISSPSEDQILTYNGTEWVNKSFQLNNFDLNALTDVEVTNPTENQILQYTDSKWKNVDNFVSLNQFADVQLSAAQDGDVIIYNQQISKFQGRSFRLNDLENVYDQTDVNLLPDNSVLAFSNADQVWKPQTFATLASRTEVTVNTGPIEDLEAVSLDAELFPGFAIYKVKCSAAPTTVSMYVDGTYRDIDMSRPEDEFPLQGIGLYAEMTPPDTAYRIVSPVIYGFNDDVPIGNTAYFKIRNRTGYYQSNIEVKLTILQVEALPSY